MAEAMSSPLSLQGHQAHWHWRPRGAKPYRRVDTQHTSGAEWLERRFRPFPAGFELLLLFHGPTHVHLVPSPPTRSRPAPTTYPSPLTIRDAVSTAVIPPAASKAPRGRWAVYTADQAKQDAVRDAMRHAWGGYAKHALGAAAASHPHPHPHPPARRPVLRPGTPLTAALMPPATQQHAFPPSAPSAPAQGSMRSTQ